MDKRAVGSAYEAMAACYLEGLGYTILEKNYHSRHGEIDIIASHKMCLWKSSTAKAAGMVRRGRLSIIENNRGCTRLQWPI